MKARFLVLAICLVCILAIVGQLARAATPLSGSDLAGGRHRTCAERPCLPEPLRAETQR